MFEELAPRMVSLVEPPLERTLRGPRLQDSLGPLLEDPLPIFVVAQPETSFLFLQALVRSALVVLPAVFGCL